jgi:hypothetical protein
VSELLDRVIEDIDWIEVVVNIDGPALLFVCVDEGEKPSSVPSGAPKRASISWSAAR